MGLEFWSAGQLAKAIRDRVISSRELTDLFIERIERLDVELNAVVVRDFDRARAAADRADEALAAGQALGPLHGIPMTIKEAYDIEGLSTTWGMPPLKGNVAARDSESVRRFKAAGAHFLGKTNVPLQLTDFQSYNEIYGTTRNPWDRARSPGGSSGGSAVAASAGLSGLESGSDVGGSIRNPAHYCGVYGHKPTWNIVPQQGHALPGMLTTPDVAVVGPIARSAEDLALCLDVVSGPEPLVEHGWSLNLPPPRHERLSDYRVALWPTDAGAPVSSEIADRVQQVGDHLASLGAKVSDSARPAFEPAMGHEIYLYMLGGMMSGSLPPEALAGMEASVANLDPLDRSYDAMLARGAVQKHGEWLVRNTQRETMRMAWRDFFEDWDILLCPQVATTAFAHDHRPMAVRTLAVDGVDQPFFQQIFWSGLATTSYLPSTVFPTGLSEEGLPIGLQAVGREYADLTCIEFARLMAEEIGGFVPPPGY